MSTTTTEHEIKRPRSHFLTDTLCEMLAFDGKPYTLSIEQQVAWDDRFAKLVAKHGEDKVMDLLRDWFNAGKLRKSSRPGEFAEFVARETDTGWGNTNARNAAWDDAVHRCRLHATKASGMAETVVLRLVTECHNDLQTAALPADLGDEQRENRKREEWPAIKRVLVECWGAELVKRWREWRAATIEEVKTGGGYRLPRMGGTG